MARTREKKEIEWKDTNTFYYTPKYKIPPNINNRYLFVYSKGKNYRKALDFAEHFAAPNNIVCVYFIDAILRDKVKKYLEGLSGNILVLYNNELNNLSVCLDDVGELLKRMAGRGYTVSQDSWSNLADSIISNMLVAREHPEIDPNNFLGFIENSAEDLYAIEKQSVYQEQYLSIWNTLSAMGCYNGTVPGEQNAHMQALEYIAKLIFPMGIEAANAPKTAYRVTKLKDMASAGVEKVPQFGLNINLDDAEGQTEIRMYDSAVFKEQNLLTLTPMRVFSDRQEVFEETGIDENAVWRSCTGRTKSVKYNDMRVVFREVPSANNVAVDLAKEIYEYANREILDNSHVDIKDLKIHFASAPWGYYDCNWYSYILGAALSRYTNGKFYAYAGVASFLLDSKTIGAVIGEAKIEEIRKRNKWIYYIIYKETTEQRKFIRLFGRLFKVPVFVQTFSEAQTYARCWCEEHIHISCVSSFDSVLYELIGPDPYGEIDEQTKRVKKLKDGEGYDSRFVDLYKISYGYEKHFKYISENFDSLRTMLNNADKNKEQELKIQYPEDADWMIPFLYKATAKAASWLWHKEKMDEWVEVVQKTKESICRNCGKVFGGYYRKDVPDAHHGDDQVSRIKTEEGVGTYNETFSVSYKDLIGINKKLYGRNTTSFLCFECLCEEQECEPNDVLDMIERYKEEGCTLF